MGKSPVFYFTRMLLGYRLPVLERLNDKLGGRLVVFSGQPPKSSSFLHLAQQTEFAFRNVHVKNVWIGGQKLHYQSYRSAFREHGFPGVVLAEESPRSVSLPFLLRFAGRNDVGRVLWGHFSSLNRRFDPIDHRQDRYRLSLARRVEACACYTDGVAARLRDYLPDEKVFVATNTIDLSSLFAQRDRLDADGRTSVRLKLGIEHNGPVLFFMGRLVPEKGTTLLLETVANLRLQGPVSLFVVGEGPDRPGMEALVSKLNLDDVRFLGPLSDEEVSPYLYAADAMLMPGYLGLIINHAFAFGVPVISRKTPDGVLHHSPEAEYVVSGENGILTDGTSAADLARAVMTIFADRDRYSANALSYARSNLTLEKMVDGLIGAIQYAEKRRPN